MPIKFLKAHEVGENPVEKFTAGQLVKDPVREKAREEARKKAEEEAKKGPSDRKVPEFGSDKDFQLVQALNQLKGRPVLISKTQVVESKEAKKEN